MTSDGKKTGGRVKGSVNTKVKKRRILEANAMKHLKNKILSNWTELFEAQLLLATGVKVQKTIGDKEVVFTKPPDAMAGQYLMNTVVGKPKETHNVNSTVQIPEIVYKLVKGINAKQ